MKKFLTKFSAKKILPILVIAVLVSLVVMSFTFANFNVSTRGYGVTPVSQFNFDVKINGIEDNGTNPFDYGSWVRRDLGGGTYEANFEPNALFGGVKLQPGMKGYMAVEIDGTETEVATAVTVKVYLVNLPVGFIFTDNLGKTLTPKTENKDNYTLANSSLTLQPSDTLQSIEYSYFLSYSQIELWKEAELSNPYINIGFGWEWDEILGAGQSEIDNLYADIVVDARQINSLSSIPTGAYEINFAKDTASLDLTNVNALNILTADICDATTHKASITATKDFKLDINGMLNASDELTVITSGSDVDSMVLGTNRRYVDYEVEANRPKIIVNETDAYTTISRDFTYDYSNINAYNIKIANFVDVANAYLTTAPNTCYDALKTLIDNKATALSDYTTLTDLDSLEEMIADMGDSDTFVGWDSVSGKFINVRNGEFVKSATTKYIDSVENYQVFRIYEGQYSTLAQTYSIYLADDQTETTIDNLAIGLDVGENDGLTTIKYVNTDTTQDYTIVIRTASSGTTLIVDDQSKGTIKHYGEAGYLNIIQCATSSYHEFGFVPQAQIAKGRVVNEVYSEDVEGIQNLFLVAKTNSSFDHIIIGASSEAEIPALDRTAVNIPSNGVLVVEIQTGVSNGSATTDEYIYLTKAGVAEQIVVSNKGNTDFEDAVEVNASTLTSGLDGKSTTTISAAVYIANVAKKNGDGQYVDENDQVISLDDLTQDNAQYTEEKASLDDVTSGSTTFASGVGTKNSPYIISNLDQWMNLVALCADDSTFVATKDKYFKVTTDLDISGKTERANIRYFAGNIDFNNNEFTGITNVNSPASDVGDDGITGIFSRVFGNVTISNLKFITTRVINNTFVVASQVVGRNKGNVNITYENISTYGTVIGANINNNGLLLAYIYGDSGSNITINNCNNYANIVGTGYKSAFLGNAGYGSVQTITIENSNNYGTIISQNKEAAMFISNPGYTGNTRICTITNCHNYGNIYQYDNNTQNTGGYGRYNLFTTRVDSHYYYTVNGVNIWQETDEYFRNAIASELSGNPVYTVASTELTIDEGKFVLNTTTDATHYALSFSFMAGGNHFGGGAGYLMEFTSEQLATAEVYVYDWINKVDATEEIVSHSDYGTYYTSGNHYVFNEDGNDIREAVFVTFTALNDDNEVLSSATYIYPSNIE